MDEIHKAAKEDQELYPFQLGQLSNEFTDRLTREIGHYSVPIVVNSKFIGSGTLVRFDKHFGILTAEHVVNYATNKAHKIDTSCGSAQKLRTSVAVFAHDLWIESRFLEIETSGIRTTDEHGPDLAFIKIPTGPFLSELRARKSFVDISISPEKRFENSAKDIGCMVAAGFPEADRFEGKSENGFEVTEGLKGWGFITGQESYSQRNNYDYVEVGASYLSKDKVPQSFGGVSGGGLWRVPIYRDRGAQCGDEYFKEFYLAGVVFWEGEVVNNHRKLRAHGPYSLYKTFFPSLFEKFR